jgi:hypothetical protein
VSCKIVNECRCCGSAHLKTVLDLGTQPLANSYHHGNNQEQYPLCLLLCEDCFHSQLSVVVDPDDMFRDYVYISGTSKTLHDYFEWFADMVQAECGKIGSVLDIACNDGTQLAKFKSRGWLTHGIDPAKNLLHLSSQNADKIVCDYLNESAMTELGNIKYDAILAQNVFAHTHDIVHFLMCCKEAMTDTTRLYIQTSQADMIENNQFDTIYHEHLSFFSTNSMRTVCERVGLKLISVKKTDIHGGSYVFTICRSGNEDSTVSNMIEQERVRGRYSVERYDNYRQNVERVIFQFREFVNLYSSKGYLVVGYGAAAKGNTFLNASGVKLHFIIDDNNLKQGLLTPGTNTMIVSSDYIKTFAHNTVFIPLAWNFHDEIRSKIKSKVDDLKFKHLFCYLIHAYYPTATTEVL